MLRHESYSAQFLVTDSQVDGGQIGHCANASCFRTTVEFERCWESVLFEQYSICKTRVQKYL